MTMAVLGTGQFELAGTVQASNDDITGNNTDAVSISSAIPVVQTTAGGGTDSGSTTDAGSGGNTGAGSADSGATTATSSNGSSGATDGTSDGATAGTPVVNPPLDDETGAMTHWFLLLLALLCSARLYGWHKRQSITVR